MNIKIITNKGERLNKLEPLFLFLLSNNRGKKDKNMYIFESTLYTTGNSLEEELFSFLQYASGATGFDYVCYNMNDYDKVKEV